MNWKDWTQIVGVLITVASVFLQGGRMLEKLDSVSVRISALADQTSALQKEVERQRGVDAVHDEKIGDLRRDVDDLKHKIR